MRRTVAGLSEDAAVRLQAIDEQVARQLDAVRAQFETRADELAGTLARGLLEIAEEVDVAATTTRDASSRVTVLAELSEAQRVEVERLLREVHDDVLDAGRGLREELVARTGELVAGLGQRVDELGLGLGGVGRHARRRARRPPSGSPPPSSCSTATTGRLDAAVAGFRAEWPTRTYEVVQGARAVAEAVVLDVRAEVGDGLDQVRAVLTQVVGTVDAARTGLDDGTDRLARAGSVLVAYLEQRDRLLEAERDRVLHDVLDAFAAGLSARERSALAGRVTDVVARRRDARDAERYRAAVGRPVPPTVSLPDQVSTLAAAARPRALATVGHPPEPEPGRSRAEPSLAGADPGARPGPAEPGPAPAPSPTPRPCVRPPRGRPGAQQRGCRPAGRAAPVPGRRSGRARTRAAAGRCGLAGAAPLPSAAAAVGPPAYRRGDRTRSAGDHAELPHRVDVALDSARGPLPPRPADDLPIGPPARRTLARVDLACVHAPTQACDGASPPEMSGDYHPRRLTRASDTRVILCVSFPPRSRPEAVLHGRHARDGARRPVTDLV